MTPGLPRNAIAILSLLVLPALAPVARAQPLVHFDFEHPLFTEPPQPVLDHCVVEQDGVYHLFYLRGNPAVNVGHATTTDFVHWDLQPPVLAPGTWDNKALWAPQLYPLNDDWWAMYYTGVNLVSSQQTGIAFSNDLFAWNKFPDPVYHPDPAWAEWSETVFSHGRDPHIIEDNGHYYMLVTAKTDNNLGAVACAVSDDLISWQDIGPIFVNLNWHVMESVFVFRHNGLFHMLFTEEAVNGTSWMSSDSLLSGWNISTRRIIDGGHAPQVTDTHLGQMFSRHAVYNDNHGNLQYVLRFTKLVWLGNIPAVPRPLPLAGEWTFPAGDAFYYQPTWNHNAAVRNDTYAKTWIGDGWINTLEYYTGPLGYGTPGQTQGEIRTGTIHSSPFTITGNSMSVLVGGSELPQECFVALVDAATDTLLFSETGRNSNEMDRRKWDLRPFRGRQAYIRIADLSTTGHVCADDVVESYEVVNAGGNSDGASGGAKNRPGTAGTVQAAPDAREGAQPARLLANAPNPFNPVTSIAYELARVGRVRLDVFDATGARVRTLVDAPRAAGTHRASWTGTDDAGRAVSSGVYFYRLAIDGAVVDTRKMVLLK